MTAEVESGTPVGGLGLEHPVARFRSSAGLRDHHRQSPPQLTVEAGQHRVHAVRIGVVEEENPHPVAPGMSEGMGDKLRPQGRPSDPDHQQVGEPAGSARESAGMNPRRDPLDLRQRRLDLARHLRGRSQAGGSQPVVADHPLFVRIGYGARFELSHFHEGLLQRGLHAGQERVGNAETTQIEAEPDLGKDVSARNEGVPGHGGCMLGGTMPRGKRSSPG